MLLWLALAAIAHLKTAVVAKPISVRDHALVCRTVLRTFRLVDVDGDDAVCEHAGDGGAVTGGRLGAHVCAAPTGGVRCWGLGSVGQLGYGNGDTVGLFEFPSNHSDLNVAAERVTSLCAVYIHTCALLESGNVKCWGENANGALGYESSVPNVGLTNVLADMGYVNVSTTKKVTQIACKGMATCALLDNGKVRCWGDLGTGGPLSVRDVDVSSTESVTQICVGASHCALC